MKKIMTTAVLLLLSLALFADDPSWGEAVNRSFTVQGGYGEVVKVVFTKIPTQSSSFAIGMPFDIEGGVQYSVTEDGREISYWSLVSNTNFKLNVTAGKLTSENEYTDSEGKYTTEKGITGKAELDYIMKFTYSFGYIQGGVQQTSTGYFTVNTGTGTVTYAKPGEGEKTVEKTVTASDEFYTVDIMPTPTSGTGLSTIGSVDGSVYFMFTQSSTSRIKNDPETVPSGNYTAAVTITVNTGN